MEMQMRDRKEVLRDEMVMKGPISALLTGGPLTIPDMAEELGYPAWEMTVWVMAMRRYGQVRELPKGRADDYYQYALVD
jgi:hypothetical protein